MRIFLKIVPAVGLEPTRPLGQQILSLPRLPFRHAGEIEYCLKSPLQTVKACRGINRSVFCLFCYTALPKTISARYKASEQGDALS